jgi:hypothetical protein
MRNIKTNIAAVLALFILGGCAADENIAETTTPATPATTATTTTAAETTAGTTADTYETEGVSVAEQTPDNGDNGVGGGAVGSISAPTIIAYADLFYDDEYTVVTVDGTDLGGEVPEALSMRLRHMYSEITGFLPELKYQVPTVYDDLLANLFSPEGDLKIAEIALNHPESDFGDATLSFLEDVALMYPDVSVTTQPGDFPMVEAGLTGFDPTDLGMMNAYFLFVSTLSDGSVYAELPYPALYTNSEDTSANRFNVSALFAACRPWNYAYVTNPTAWLASQFGDYLEEGHRQIMSVDSADENVAMFASLNPDTGKYNIFIVNNSDTERYYTFNIEKTEAGGDAVYRRVTAFDPEADPQWSVEEDAFYPVDHDNDEQVAPGTFAYSVTLPAYSVTTLSGNEQLFTLNDPYSESVSTYNDPLTLPYDDSFDYYDVDYLETNGGVPQFALGGMKIAFDSDGNGFLRSEDEANGFGDALNIGDSKWVNLSLSVNFKFNEAEYLSIGTSGAENSDISVELRADGSWYVLYSDINTGGGGSNDALATPLDTSAWHMLTIDQTEDGVLITLNDEALYLCEGAYLQGAVHLFGKVGAEFDNLFVTEGYPLYEAE